MPQWNGSPAVWHTASFTRNGTPRNGPAAAESRFIMRPLEALVDDRVQRGVQPFDAGDRGVDELAARTSPRATSSACAVASSAAKSSLRSCA